MEIESDIRWTGYEDGNENGEKEMKSFAVFFFFLSILLLY